MSTQLKPLLYMREMIDAAKEAAQAGKMISAEGPGPNPFEHTPGAGGIGGCYGMVLTDPLAEKARRLRLLAGEAAALMNELARDGAPVSFSIVRDEDEGYTARVKITKVTEL